MTKLPIGWATAWASHLRETKGHELTPGEVRRNAVAALAKIRKHMRELGYQVPDGDLEMLEHINRLREIEEQEKEIERILSQPIDDSDLPELTPEEKKRLDEQCERILAKVQLTASEDKPWVVTHNGHIVLRHANEAAAVDDAHDRNCRASRLGVDARYDCFCRPVTPAAQRHTLED